MNLRRFRLVNSPHSFGDSVVELARGLECLRPEKLVELEVTGDGIEDAGATAFAAAIVNCEKLSEITRESEVTTSAMLGQKLLPQLSRNAELDQFPSLQVLPDRRRWSCSAGSSQLRSPIGRVPAGVALDGASEKVAAPVGSLEVYVQQVSALLVAGTAASNMQRAARPGTRLKALVKTCFARAA